MTSLRASAAALQAFQRSVAVAQNNVVNASTPGYVRQGVALSALDFNPAAGLAGGVAAGDLVSSRNAFAEAAVRRELSLLGDAEQSATQLAWLESAVDLNDAAGIPAALDRLYTAFRSWSIAPSSSSERENVHAAATNLATAFNRTAQALNQSSADARDQIVTTLDNINTLTDRIRTYNEDRRRGGANDAGVEAKIHVALEQLSELVDVQALWQPDGTVTVLAGNQAPLVVGDRQYSLKADFVHTEAAPLYPDAPTPVTISDASGNDVTSLLSGGKLGALIRYRNETSAEYLGDANNLGSLNRLAKQVADRVNTILAAGYPHVDPPYNLFVYGSSSIAIAHSVSVNPTLLPALMQATDPTAPPINDTPLKLADLTTWRDPALEGLTFTAYFGKLSASAGRLVAEANEERDSRQLLATQARTVRDDISGISLDEEAVRMMEFQRAYEATSRVVSALDEMSRIAVNLGRA
jgi:flagellar hook-associated protein 1 FlgK